jgi:hypothetical protein
MKCIVSPFDDIHFNEFLLQYVKKYLKEKCRIFTKDSSERKYHPDEKSRKFYTHKDVINSLILEGRKIKFSNNELINYIVYDLGQRFWYDALKNISNLIYRIFFEYKRQQEDVIIQQRKLSREKKARRRY